MVNSDFPLIYSLFSDFYTMAKEKDWKTIKDNLQLYLPCMYLMTYSTSPSGGQCPQQGLG